MGQGAFLTSTTANVPNFELNTSIIALSIFTESLIKLQAKVLKLFEKECILGLKTIS